MGRSEEEITAELVETLMGRDADRRCKFIMANANFADRIEVDPRMHKRKTTDEAR